MKPQAVRAKPFRRSAAIHAGVVLAHLALFALMIRSPTVVPTPQAQSAAMTVSLFDLSKPLDKPTPETPPTVEPTPDVQPDPPVEISPPSAPLAPPTPPPLDVLSLVKTLAVADPTRDPRPLSRPAPSQPLSAVALSQTADRASTCEMTQQLQARLQIDPAVGPALQAIPRQARSVANAIMLWDGAWIIPASSGETQAREALRAAILTAIDASPSDCRTQTVLGPRLLVVPGTGGSTLLVLGSGAWRWDDLILTAPVSAVG